MVFLCGQYALAIIIVEFLTLDKDSPLTADGGMFEQEELRKRGGIGIDDVKKVLSKEWTQVLPLFEAAIYSRNFASCPLHKIGSRFWKKSWGKDKLSRIDEMEGIRSDYFGAILGNFGLKHHYTQHEFIWYATVSLIEQIFSRRCRCRWSGAKKSIWISIHKIWKTMKWKYYQIHGGRKRNDWYEKNFIGRTLTMWDNKVVGHSMSRKGIICAIQRLQEVTLLANFPWSRIYGQVCISIRSWRFSSTTHLPVYE